jgi:molecular chaperone GrpE
MPDEGANGPSPNEVKVVDRRRFTPDGEPRAEDAREALPEAVPGELDERDARLREAEAQVDELKRAYAAQVEEMKAARARMEREKQRVLELERAEVAHALLAALDELERALAAAGDAAPGTPLASVVDGVRLTVAGLAKRVADLGAQRLDLVGKPFDPRVAEAVDLAAVSDPAQDGIVVEEVQAGYRIGERLLRAARVRVGRVAQA